jgi:Cof subfamily protein (haloacid dehalogenase superfamily)
VIRLVCTDVDGTLVGKSGIVPPAVWDAAARTRASGIRMAVCSGRPAFGVTLGYAERLDADGWHVFQNGSSVLHLGTQRSLSTTIAAETIAELVRLARATGRVLELYTDTEYAVESDGEAARQHAALLGVPFVARPFESLKGGIVRAQWLVARHDAETGQREKQLGLEVVASPSPLMPETLFVNLTAAGVSKGSAVRTVAKEYGFALADVMMVGDALNDVGAMQAVGFAVAMGNAEPGVRESARAAVGDVEDGGVAQAFEMARTGSSPP